MLPIESQSSWVERCSPLPDNKRPNHREIGIDLLHFQHQGDFWCHFMSHTQASDLPQFRAISRIARLDAKWGQQAIPMFHKSAPRSWRSTSTERPSKYRGTGRRGISSRNRNSKERRIRENQGESWVASPTLQNPRKRSRRS